MNALQLVLLAACCACVGALTYKNPVVPGASAPDPGALYDPATKAYYVVTTGQNNGNAFPIRKSSDLVHWSIVGAIFPAGKFPSWASRDFWAPELHLIHGTYYAVYTARDKTGRLCNGIAWSTKSVVGPFIDYGSCFIRNASMGYIDSNLYHDVRTNKTYYLWKDDANDFALKYTPIYGQEIDLSRAKPALVGNKVFLFQNDLSWEGNLVEAPWMTKRGEYFYVFYSAYHYYDATYCVGVARSKSALGPYTKHPSQVLKSNKQWVGPGHCSVLTTASGASTFMLYHSWQEGHVHGPGDPRLLLMDLVLWDSNGWPYVQGGSPSASDKPVPV